MNNVCPQCGKEWFFGTKKKDAVSEVPIYEGNVGHHVTMVFTQDDQRQLMCNCGHIIKVTPQ